MDAPCPLCGFDSRSVKPGDAAVALRSFPRRYHGLLVRPDEDEVEDPVRRAGSSGWSALAHAAGASEGIRAADEALRAAIVHDHPGVALPELDPAVVPSTGTVGATLERLEAATKAAATTIEQAHGKDWSRRASAGADTVTAEQIAALAAHIGVHHLRAAEAVLREVVGRP